MQERTDSGHESGRAALAGGELAGSFPPGGFTLDVSGDRLAAWSARAFLSARF